MGAVLRRIVPLVMSILLIASIGFCQATEATILGLVVDSSGAVVPRATVTVTNLGTGVAWTTVTSANGEYAVANLPVGSYKVEVTESGFKTGIQVPIQLDIKSRARVDFTLQLGSQTQTVQVTSQAPLLQTDTPEVGETLSRELIHDLPIVNRNFLTMASLVPGTTPGPPSGTQKQLNGVTLTSDGANAEANNYIIDGVSANQENNGAMTIVPAMDAIQEFKVQNGQFSAEFGRATGAVVNMAIKSGTNQFHGFAYDYLRNDALDARSFFDVSKPPLRQNQFGGGLGGPIRKDKIFFFGNYEGFRSSHSSQFIGIMPTPLEKRGDFTESGYTVYDPNTTHQDPNNPSQMIRDPFPGNVIPADRINPATSALLQFYPNPNFSVPGTSENYLQVFSNTDTNNTWDAKVDYNVRQRDTLSVRFSQQKRTLYRQGFLPQQANDGETFLNGINTGLVYSHIFSPHLLNEFRVSYNYGNFTQTGFYKKDFLAPFNIPGRTITPQNVGYPFVIVRNITAAVLTRPISTIPNPWALVEQTDQVLDSVTYQKGAHTIKFGGGWDHPQHRRNQGYPADDIIGSNGEYTSQVPGQLTGSGIGDFLLGLSNRETTQYSLDAVRLVNNRANAFIQDYWRLNRKLTLSLGLRWDMVGQYRERRDRMSNFDFKTGVRIIPSDTQSLIDAAYGPLPPTFQFRPADQVIPHTNYRDFSPRVGFAYSPDNRVVIRGGYGIFFGVAVANPASNQGTDPPFRSLQGFIGDVNNPVLVSNGFPSPVGAWALPTTRGFYRPIHGRDPYSQKWSADLQFSPTSHSMIDVGYTGAHILGLYQQLWGNIPLPGPGPIQPRRPYPNIGFLLTYQPVGLNSYNGLEITFKQDMSHGLSVLSAFTYASDKCLSYGVDDNLLTDPWNNRYDYGPCAFDIRTRWVTGLVYNLPTASSFPAAFRAVLGHWQTSTLVTLQSGFPFTVGMDQDTLNSGISNRPDMSGDPNLPNAQRTLFRWFDTTKFSIPQPYVFGTETKNPLRGPGLATVDFAIQKSFPLLSERRRLTFRMEASNFFNRPNFGLPNAVIDEANFGVIQSVATPPRQIQMVLRFEF